MIASNVDFRHNLAHVLGGTFDGRQPKQFVTFLDPKLTSAMTADILPASLDRVVGRAACSALARRRP
jgi:hypothetical protein